MRAARNRSSSVVTTPCRSGAQGRLAPIWRKAGWLGPLLLLVCSAWACNRAPCAGVHAPSTDEDAPHIVNVELVSQDVINPWQFNFAIDFTDRNGDVGAGQLDLYVGASEPATLELSPYFATSGLPANSTAGRVGVDLNLSTTAQDDTILRFGFQLRDALLNYSNCYSVDFHFDISKLSQRQPLKSRRVPCRSQLARLQGR